MPIDYTYGGTSTGLGALVANRAGAAQGARRDQERQFEELLRLAQLGENQRQFDIGAAQRQQGIDFGQQQANRTYNYGVIRDMNLAAQRVADQQAQLQQGAVEFERGLFRDQLQSERGQENMVLQNELLQDRDMAQQARQREQDQYQFGVQSATTVDTQAKEMLSGFRKMPLNEQGQQTLNEFSSRIRRLQGQRATMRPGEYTQAMGQLLSEMEEAGIDDYAQELPTIDKMIESGQLKREEDGSGWWGIEYRNGQAVPRFFPKPKDTGKVDNNVETPFGSLPPDKAVSTKLDFIGRARKELIEEATVPGENGGRVSKYPTKADVIKRAQELMEIEDELFGDKPGGSTAATSFGDKPPEVPPAQLQAIVPLSSPEEIQQMVSDGFVGYFAGPDGKIHFRNKAGKILRDDSWGSVTGSGPSIGDPGWGLTRGR